GQIHLLSSAMGFMKSPVLTYGERVHGPTPVFLSGTQYGRRERGLIGRIGEVLCFETEAIPLIVHFSAFSSSGSIQEVAGIELNAGFRCVQLHNAARLRFVNRRAQTQFSRIP